jgi:S-adenosylmethionine:tRNA ribosyltransferase-isomerase
MDPRNISIKDYSYILPEEKIAAFPLAERDQSKLLIYKDGKIDEDIYRNLANHLPAGSLLIFNNTKVVEARILFQKPTGGVIEIFCLEPHEQYPDISTAFATTGKVHWNCLVGGASKWKRGQVLEKKIVSGNQEIILRAAYVEKRTDSFIIELSWSPSALSFAEILHRSGAIPLPPYIKRKPETSDSERYQTVYAHSDGSVAAPTAGLHFTEKIFSDLRKKNIKQGYLTLHVGAGTFKPVKSQEIGGHEMHAEWIDVSIDMIELIIENLEKGIVAVGTTSLRTLESLYWMGLREYLDPSAAGKRFIAQWEVYDLEDQAIPSTLALRTLSRSLTKQNETRLLAKTQILIAPGYHFRIVKGLITNFHQPQSTLLLLVAAFIGEGMNETDEGWRNVYDHALANNFRFLSYGDGCLLWRKGSLPHNIIEPPGDNRNN